jgi:hypothetical protein
VTLVELCAGTGGGARVLVSEAEALPLPGWSARRLPARKAEWVLASWQLAAEAQLALW